MYENMFVCMCMLVCYCFKPLIFKQVLLLISILLLYCVGVYVSKQTLIIWACHFQYVSVHSVFTSLPHVILANRC